MKPRLLYVVNVDTFFISHRLPVALEAQRSGYDVHVATRLSNGSELLKSYGFTVHSINKTFYKSRVLRAVEFLFDLTILLLTLRPTLAHVVTVYPLLIGGVLCRITKVPALISAVSGLGYNFTGETHKAKIPNYFVVKLYAVALGHSNQRVVFQNPSDRDVLMRLTNLPLKKTELIKGSGVDLEKFRYFPPTTDFPIVLFPARYLIHKGILEFVDAARSLLLQDRRIARFVLVGGVDASNPTSVSPSQVSEWQSEGIIENWGYCVDMPSVYAQSTLVVLPSYREGLPKALIEAASCGRAVITTDVPGCRDAIKDNVTGLLVPPYDAPALSQAIRRLLDNQEERDAMALAGRRLAQEEFGVDQVIVKHMEIYQGLLR